MAQSSKSASIAAKILAAEGFTPVNKATLDALKKVHSTEENLKESIIVHHKLLNSVKKMFRNSWTRLLRLQQLVLQKCFPNFFCMLYSVPL